MDLKDKIKYVLGSGLTVFAISLFLMCEISGTQPIPYLSFTIISLILAFAAMGIGLVILAASLVRNMFIERNVTKKNAAILCATVIAILLAGAGVVFTLTTPIPFHYTPDKAPDSDADFMKMALLNEAKMDANDIIANLTIHNRTGNATNGEIRQSVVRQLIGKGYPQKIAEEAAADSMANIT